MRTLLRQLEGKSFDEIQWKAQAYLSCHTDVMSSLVSDWDAQTAANELDEKY